MSSTALAVKVEYDEVPVSATEILEANVAAIRDSLKEFKQEMRAALGAVTGEIKSVRDEIKSVRDEIKSVREKSDRNFERLSTKIDATNRELHDVSERGIRTEARLGSLIWFWGSLGGVGGLLTIIMTIAKIFHWF